MIKKFNILLRYLEQIRQIVNIPIVTEDQIISIVETAVKQAQTEDTVPRGTPADTAPEEKQEKLLPHGKKISTSDIDLDGQYFLVLNNWIAKQKNIPTKIECTIEEVTTKAVQIKHSGKLIWLPKSQIKEVFQEDD